MAWQFQLKFQIYIFGVMILQMKQKTEFWKIGPCIFKSYPILCVREIWHSRDIAKFHFIVFLQAILNNFI